MNVTVYTLEAVKTVFVELFSTPKKFNRKPVTLSKRTRRQYEQNLLENFAEDDFGQWTIDEVTGEQRAH